MSNKNQCPANSTSKSQICTAARTATVTNWSLVEYLKKLNVSIIFKKCSYLTRLKSSNVMTEILETVLDYVEFTEV